MDAYRKKLISTVKTLPCLWDPSHRDYSDKDSRKLVWQHVDHATASTLPDPKLNAKIVWDILMRCHSNALRRKRKRKRASIGARVDLNKVWKYEKEMSFLVPVKNNRVEYATGQPASEPDDIAVDSADDDNGVIDGGSCTSLGSILIAGKKEAEGSRDSESNDDEEVKEVEEDEEKEEEGGIQEEVNAMTEPTQKHTIATGEWGTSRTTEEPMHELVESCRITMDVMRQLLAEQSNETPCLSFFKSLVPMVEDLDGDAYLDFQLCVLQDLKRLRAESALRSEHQAQSAQPVVKLEIDSDASETR